MIDFERHPDSYRHWDLEIDDVIATLTLVVDPDAGAFGDYKLKLNSYDIGVDIELADAIRRIRFEHPGVRCVILTGGVTGTFCAGANIRMLAAADHSHKVNFCRFTNETRLEIEDASENSSLRFLAAVNGACSGGGYELAMSCDHILLVDDHNSAVSLPEVPLLGVLPGTGGLTRLTDKRHVRRDRVDVFATRAEGIRGAEAVEWGLIDELAPPSSFESAVQERALALAETSTRSTDPGVVLGPLDRATDGDNIDYRYVSAAITRSAGLVDITVRADREPTWPLTAVRELDDLLCHLRFNETEIGTITVRTIGDVDDVLAHDESLISPSNQTGLETALLWRRTLSRLDLTARSIIAIIEPGSCFAGVLGELAFAADRSYMLDGVFEDDDDPLPAATLQLSDINFGPMAMLNGISRLRSRFWGDAEALTDVKAARCRPLIATEARELGLVTAIPDDLDWFDELRLALEERASYSPDALTAMEANNRFCGPETMATKIFGRLSSWQNWVFIRPNASGPEGALRRYGTGKRPEFDRHRS